MLNAYKLALDAARNVVLEYKDQNKRLFEEYRDAYTTIKLAVKNNFKFIEAINNNNRSLSLYFIDEEEFQTEIAFTEYTGIRVAQAFCKAYQAANTLNELCF